MTLRVVRLGTSAWLFIPGALLSFNIPFAHLVKIVMLVLVLLIVPQIYVRSPCEAAFTSKLADVLLQDFQAKSWGRKLRQLRVLFRNTDTWKAVVAFLIKLYVWEKGVVIEKKYIQFDQPVFYRVLNPPMTDCKSGLTREQERDFMLWETRECHIFESGSDFSTSIYVPAVMNAEGTERRCLQSSGTKSFGRIISSNEGYPGPASAFKHPLNSLRRDCNRMKVDCDHIVSARTFNGTTWVLLNSTSKSLIIYLGGHHRPGLTCIRESSLAAKNGADDVSINRIALGVENALRYSSCFAKSRLVKRGPRIPHLVVNLCSLAVLVCFELVLFRSSYFNVEKDVYGYVAVATDG